MIRPVIVIALLLAALLAVPAAAAQTACEGLLTRDFSRVPDAPTHLTAAEHIEEAGWPAYCRVQGYVAPQVGLELRVPLQDWNERLLFIGCGGFCGGMSQISRCREPLARGYACVTTNLGHRSTPFDGKWAYNNRQLEIDFYFRATHVTAVAGKALLAALTGAPPAYSYISGCSTGGRQGLISAQRFPADFDGVIAGAPAGVSPGGGLHLIWSALANRGKGGEPMLSEADVGELSQAVLSQCDAVDGLEDGIIDHPPSCEPDLDAITCPQDGWCLTGRKRAVVERIYAGPRNPAGEPLYAARPVPSSEPNWVPAYVRDAGPSIYYLFGGDFFRYLAFAEDPGPDWQPEDFDWQLDPPRLKFMRVFNNAANIDLSEFANRGGKLILYQGWRDQSVPPQGVIDYYEQTRAAMGDPTADDMMRLYMMPGVDHCLGGPGPDQVDWLTYLENWVERDQAPDLVLARKLDASGTQELARPLAPYPARTGYRGRGDWRSADSFRRLPSP